MLTLAIDTALSSCSVAIVSDEVTLIARVEPMARGQAERLAPMVRDVVGEAGIAFSAFDRIAVTRGPGAFTGIRIGLSFARGLALALQRPCVGISTLEVLAAGASQPRIVAAINVAGGLFIGAWDGRLEVFAPCKAEVESVLADLEGDWAVTGPGASLILVQRPDWHHVAQDLPSPVVLAHLARHADPASHPPDPLYLRAVDAKLPGGLTLEQSLE
jgi:tRNA threonylcarbamoyladenosine biosynthesis protein TsaB